MLSNCFFPDTADTTSGNDAGETKVDVQENDVGVNINDHTNGGEHDDNDDDDDDVAQENRDDSSLRDEADKGNTPSSPNNNSNKGIMGDFSLFRDFFLAAFSDGYYKVSCCGSEGLFPGSTYCNPQRRLREVLITESFGSTSQHAESQSNQSNDITMNRSGSYEGLVIGPPRKRPLAVAVGFKYAEDMDGRPIVITPNSRRISMNNNKMGTRPPKQPSSPSSESVTSSKTFDISPNLFMPFDIPDKHPSSPLNETAS